VILSNGFGFLHETFHGEWRSLAQFFFEHRTIKMEAANDAIAVYCKAQTQMNNIDQSTEEKRKALHERIKTCKSLIEDDLRTRKVPCVEMYTADSEDPIYFRMKQGTQQTPLTVDRVIEIITRLKAQIQSGDFAEKYSGDIPDMFVRAFKRELKIDAEKNGADKPSSLTITASKERDVVGVEHQHNLSEDISTAARDLLDARKELSTLRTIQRKEKKPCMDEQKRVSDDVKTVLKQADPVHMTNRVHMMQNGNEWTYYLRCKENTHQKKIGVRVIAPLIKSVAETTLEKQGLSAKFTENTMFGNKFWVTLTRQLEQELGDLLNQHETTSNLSLDRGAPRKRR